MTTHVRVAVTERSQVSAARLEARTLARTAGFSAEDEYRAGLVVTELATNLVKHTREGGEILLRPGGGRDKPALEIVALDRGPGIADIARALTDGISTAASAGTGLGAIRRLSDGFDVHSTPAGTAVLSLLAARREALPAPPVAIGGVSVSAPGESLCGDLWSVLAGDKHVTIVVADGLGHGPGAHEAARAVIEAVPRDLEPLASLDRAHQAVRHTRGAAAALARLESRAQAVSFAGVGNISGLVANGTGQHQMVSMNGTLGHRLQSPRQFRYAWPPDSIVVLFSDGLTSHWSLDRYPGLARRHPALIAAVLYRDHSRRRDDVTVVVARRSAA